MEFWANKMPEGMLLKSDGFASNLFDPANEYSLGEFCRAKRHAYHDMLTPVALRTFVEYGLAFSRRFAPDLKNALVVSLRRAGDRFTLTTDSGDTVIARRVVVATGVGPFQFTPPPLWANHPARVAGNKMMLEAKIGAITPDMLILSGRWLVCPAYTRRPCWRLA